MFGLTDRNALLAYHQKPKQLVVNSMHKQCTAGGTLEALLGGDYMYIGSIGQNLHADDGSVPRLPCSYLTANCDLKVAHFTSRKVCTVQRQKESQPLCQDSQRGQTRTAACRHNLSLLCAPKRQTQNEPYPLPVHLLCLGLLW